MGISLPPRRVNKSSDIPTPSLVHTSWSSLLNTPIKWDKAGFLNIYIDSFDKENIPDDLKKIEFIKNLGNLKSVTVHSSDFKTLCYMSTMLKDLPVTKEAVLLDDFKNEDRSYIDSSRLENNMTLTSIPFSYTMWNAPYFTDSIKELGSGTVKTDYNFLGSSISTCDSRDYFLTPETIASINEQIDIFSKLPNLNTLDKVILVSNYIQRTFQFVEDTKSVATDGVYVVDNLPDNFDPRNVNLMMNQRSGVCSGFARLMVAMLNNPVMNVDCRIQKGSNHEYCIITDENGNTYCSDPTWGITRNPNRFENTLKAKSFFSDYILVGEEELSKMPHHENISIIVHPLNKESIDKSLIETSINKLKSYGISFDYPKEIPFPSSRREIEELEK